MDNFDFSGWATRNDLLCGDGRTIRRDAFKDNDGQTVPLIWNHDHLNQDAVLGHALLENRAEGVYAYCKFNDTEQGQMAKEYVRHGDVRSLSIHANQLKQIGNDVIHGTIRELSLVLAGANPGASIDYVMAHGDGEEESMIINYDESALMLYHSDDKKTEDKKEEEKPVAEEKKEKTIKDVFEELTEEQQDVMYAVLGYALEDKDNNEEENEEENKTMKHNVFDKETQETNVLTHADEVAILDMAKKSNVGSFRAAMEMYAQENDSLKHGFVNEEGENAIETLFPEYKLLKPGAPETVERDMSWVDHVLNGIHKSPISRIRTRNADARVAELRAKGYNNREQEKALSGNIKLITRTTDPQTVYRKDEMHRDDILDIQDFDMVAYLWNIMRHNLNEELALAALIGDGRDDGSADKIHETHIRSIWNDDELYTIHKDVDIAAAKAELQGTNTGANFGENYIYAEAIISAALYSRENYKGSGNLEFYCTPHLLNVMLLARDLNGRRIYSSKADLAAALNVRAIHTVEQFEGKTRTDKAGKEHKLLGLFVNLGDYQFGCAKGGEITKFEDFDIDFNKYKYLMETRLSGSLTKLWSAIALEEPVTVEPQAEG